MTLKFNSKFLLPLVIGFLITLFASNILINNYFILTLDNQLIDFHFNRRGSVFSDSSNKVIVIGISNETLKELPPPYNKWPLARNLFAKVLKNLNDVKVKVIGIDILFNEPDRYDEKNDSLFLEEIKRFNNVVLAAKLNELDERFITLKNESKNYSNYFYSNDDELIGFVNVIPDFDGVIRRYYPSYFDLNNQKNVATFSFSVFDKYKKIISKQAEEKQISFSEKSTEFPLHDPILINYFGPPNTFPIIELIDIIDDKDFKTVTELETGEEINTWDDSLTGLKYSGLFQDKIILMGSVEPEDKDIYPVSISSDTKMEFGNLMYGVEIHANVVQMLIEGNPIKKVSNWVVLILIFFTAFFCTFLFEFHKKFKAISLFASEFFNLILVVIFLFLIYEISFRLFNSNYFLSITSVSLTTITVYLGSLVMHYLSERKQKLMIKNMFGHYVSSKIVEDLIENPQKLKLGGERKELSILFSDITNFTTLSESIEPEILVDFMNDYFDSMSEIIFRYNGTLDKFEGDAVMAFWGAPIEDPNHALNAINTALEMRKETYKISERWKEKLRFNIKTRIGINTGEVIVGNMGSKRKFDFTVMGDSVNISARLEAINKFYGTDIIISERTLKNIDEKFLTRELDYLLVKGKSKPIKIFQLISSANESSDINWQYISSEFEEGLHLYRQKEFNQALKRFENILRLYPNDEPSKLYTKRCEEYIKNPPDEKWQGISEVLIK